MTPNDQRVSDLESDAATVFLWGPWTTYATLTEAAYALKLGAWGNAPELARAAARQAHEVFEFLRDDDHKEGG